MFFFELIQLRVNLDVLRVIVFQYLTEAKNTDNKVVNFELYELFLLDQFNELFISFYFHKFLEVFVRGFQALAESSFRELWSTSAIRSDIFILSGLISLL